MNLITKLPFVPAPLALGIIITVELLCIVWCMARVLKQSTKQTVILERIAAALSHPVASEEIANPRASPELLRLVGDHPFDSPLRPASQPRQTVVESSLSGYNKRRK